MKNFREKLKFKRGAHNILLKQTWIQQFPSNYYQYSEIN